MSDRQTTPSDERALIVAKGVAQTDIPGGRQKSGRPMTDDSRPTEDVVHIALAMLDPDMLTSADGSRVTVALAAVRQIADPDMIADPDILKSADEKAPPRIEVPAEAVRGILKD